MSERSDLDKVSRQEVAFILNEIEGKPLNEQKELAYPWAIKQGFTGSLVEELIFRQAEFKADLADFKDAQKKARKAADKEYELLKEKLIKEKRWDAKLNCEVPKLNSHDPDDIRFGGSGTKGSKSDDVKWRSNS